MEINFIVYGEAVAQARPRFRNVKTKDGRQFTHTYEPKKSTAYKDKVYDAAVDVKPDKPFEGPLMLSVKIYRGIPKSFSKTKRNLAIAGELRPVTKPDIDNYLKGIKDALKTVIWRDDSQVVSYGTTGKWYAEVPRVEIMVKEL